ncbi:MAG: hypothetical protein M3380_15850, partial [Chloroflexota bacterium]|nr:hypothetical protein [Chloroflexota bacterium]
PGAIILILVLRSHGRTAVAPTSRGAVATVPTVRGASMRFASGIMESLVAAILVVAAMVAVVMVVVMAVVVADNSWPPSWDVQAGGLGCSIWLLM